MKTAILTWTLGVFLLTTGVQHLCGAPRKEHRRSTNEWIRGVMGQEFKIKDVEGFTQTVAVVEQGGRQYIRSQYRRGGAIETRQYAIPRRISSFSCEGYVINVYFESPKGGKEGAVYVINPHGEAVKVDDIKTIDLIW